MSEELNEQFEGHGHADFDWDELSRRLGEATDNDLEDVDFVRIRKAILTLLEWMIEPVVSKRKRKRPAFVISRRAVALAWVMCPELFSTQNKTSSLSDVARALKLHKAVLSEETSAFSKQFKFRNQFQIGHGWNFKKKPKK
ncbi:MAG TPA: hypothetical protein VFB72_19385 [Verrucomicrobiae bacterium]|nr:hypothetical protein [Verrucomicrobiae bacterium]